MTDSELESSSLEEDAAGTETEQNMITRLMRGEMKHLPIRQSNAVRIFISSTFTGKCVSLDRGFLYAVSTVMQKLLWEMVVFSPITFEHGASCFPS